MLITYGEAKTQFRLNVPEHLDLEDPVPVVGAHRQGDVCFLPEKHEIGSQTLEYMREVGEIVKVVAGEADRNSHQLTLIKGAATFYRGSFRDDIRDYGLLVLEDDTELFFEHTSEHGASIISSEKAKSYRFFGQFDFASQRRVAD